jgi:hypothetical protein
VFVLRRERSVKVIEMPQKGYAVVTIHEDVLTRAKDYIARVNKEAGYMKIRNESHLVEEAIVELMLEKFKQEAESPEEFLHKVMKIAFERDDLLRLIFKGLLELPKEDANLKLNRILKKTELKSLGQILKPG